MKKIFLFLPILVILIISTFLLIYLLQNKEPNKPPSALLNENLPEFTIVNLLDKNEIFNIQNIEKKFVLINFFASWCAPCKVEHPLFFEIKKQHPNLYLIGINHKDKKNDAIKYLNSDGNPYDFIGVDGDGFIGLEFGVFGLPETFLVNSSGIVINKFLGPLTKKIINDEIKPYIK